jgi:methylmalonyl-CoA/ethylmalonyl-CoA epimerase
MSDGIAGKIGSGVFQVAIVVRDLDRAVEVATEQLGAGPFSEIQSTTEKVYRGRRIEPVQRIASGTLGPVVLELIQPISGESLFWEFLEKHGEGVHHLGTRLASPNDYQAALDRLAAAGFPSAQSGRKDGLAYDYIDTEAALGTYFELVWRAE